MGGNDNIRVVPLSKNEDFFQRLNEKDFNAWEYKIDVASQHTTKSPVLQDDASLKAEREAKMQGSGLQVLLVAVGAQELNQNTLAKICNLLFKDADIAKAINKNLRVVLIQERQKVNNRLFYSFYF